MSSSSSSSPSSSSPSTSPFDSGNAAGTSTVRQRRDDFEGPSSSRRRAVSEVWPEPFLEALAAQVAIAASRNSGRLAAAAALANVFQVCSTWRAVSRSDLLWRRLTRRIWGRTRLLQDTWRDEYVYWHRTARNFRTRRYAHTILYFDPSDVDDADGLTCRCLTLSDNYLACGFADGAVRLFDLATRLHVSTYRPHQRDRLGRFSRAVTGIVISNSRLTFATLDGDIHVADVPGPPITRRAHLGQVMDDGVLVDFTGCGRWWVGLYAGVPGRAIHIWDSNTEELVYVGGELTEPEAVVGWHMLTEMSGFVGRVRVTTQETAVACTSARVIVFDLRNGGEVLAEEQYRRGIVVTATDVSDAAYVVVGNRGLARVRRVDTSEELCRFSVRGAGQMGAMGCMNGGYALMCAGGVIRVWEVERGEELYTFWERVGAVNAFVCDERHVVAWGSDATLHLWDFGGQE
ncbi:putative transcription factor WD40-like family [Rosa chinensis]|uniref:Putative transcription factor WD40-like family n=1 Tax=Rosa chinensis TaxID=74649 RepID=A0A2P6S1F3_ROSCH|nr:transcriptional regulator STERILE APETALA [Rosa chinensis]PRQ52501.1 putative transcription factor WD40-like family [Rosa chinensis]